MSNYPDGVSDAHPHFNPSERPVTVTCTSDEALVIPSFVLKAALFELQHLAGGDYKGDGGLGRPANMGTVLRGIEQLQASVDLMEKDGTYECDWEGELELPVSEEAEWDCPRCGVTQTTDTTPDERDPDDAYDRMKEARYDD